MNTLRRYLRIYLQLVLFSIKSSISYRWNFFIQMLYGPAYVVVLYLMFVLVYANAPSLGGWEYHQAEILFFTFNWVYTVSLFVFTKTVRYYLWTGFRQGDLDMVLTKPVSTKFLATVSRPATEQLGLVLGLTGLLIWKLFMILPSTSWLNFGAYLIMLLLGQLMAYFAITTYQTFGLHLVKAGQLYEVFDKVTDYAFYPLNIFPQSIRLVALTIVPMAFFAYIPTRFLFGIGNVGWLAIGIGGVILAGFINHWAWQVSLKKYASASS